MSVPTEEEEALISAVTTAWRRSDPEELKFHPAWYDLDTEGRARAFEATLEVRALESALDAEGLSTTSRTILDRIRNTAR